MRIPSLARPQIFRRENLAALFLLAVMLMSMSGSLAAAGWTGGLHLLAWAALGGLAMGALLAPTRVRGWIAHLLMIVTGIAASLALAALILPDIFTTEQKINLTRDIWRTWLTLKLAGEFAVYIFICKQGFLVTDVILPNEKCTDSIDPNFLTIMLMLNWLLAYAAAWFLFRRARVWGAIFLPGAAIIINLFYSLPQNSLYLLLFLLSMLLLLVRVHLSALESRWRKHAVGYAADIGFDFFISGATFAVLLLLLAWMLPPRPPGPAWVSLLDPWQTAWQDFEENWRGLFGLRAVGRPQPTTFTGASLLMGGPIRLTQKPVMDIRTDGGRYWRGAVYDHYNGAGWITSRTEAINLNANDARPLAVYDSLRREITQTISIFLPEQNLVYAAAQPLKIDLPVEIKMIPPAAAADLAFIRNRRTLREGDKYTVISAISIANEDALRAASRKYPDALAQTYLQLPDGLPQRVRDLARTFAQKYPTPYDQAVAIESYLREKVKYNESVAAPPAGRDAVDYMLFDRPEGYCNYYASAMAVLARAISIPARVASGFARGDYQNGVYRVLESNAHAWTELYFPGYGWIEFEPTASQPSIDRPRSNDVGANADAEFSEGSRARGSLRDSELPEDEFDSQRAAPAFTFPFLNDPGTLFTWLTGIVGIAGVGVFGARQWRTRERFARLSRAAQAYEEMLARARWLGVPPNAAATPYENARALARVMPRAQPVIERVAGLYVRELYRARALPARDLAALKSDRRVFFAAWRQQWIKQIMLELEMRVKQPAKRIKELLRRI